MDEHNQGLCSKLSTMRNYNTCNATICPELLVAHHDSGSFWFVLCIQFLIYPTHTGTANSPREIHNSLWSHSTVPRHWKLAGTTFGRYVQHSFHYSFGCKSDLESYFIKPTPYKHSSSVFISSVMNFIGMTCRLFVWILEYLIHCPINS